MERLELPLHDDVADELARLQLGADASELHGSLSGFLSAHGELSRRDWLQRLEIEPDPLDLAPDGALDRLYLATRAQLGDPDLGFALLLPDDEQPVDLRAESLVGWCRGFLGGFGLAGKSLDALSEEAREALDDLGKIAASSLSYDEPEQDEAALVEVSEFVRVAALLLHGDGLDDDGPGTSRRVH